MRLKTSRRASATVRKLRRSRGSHSSVAKKLSHIALSYISHRAHRLHDARRLPAPLPEGQRRVLRALDKHESVQGAQFTSGPVADRVLGAGVAFSMDGRGRFHDNIFIERLWRSRKYEAVYPHELRNGLDAEWIIGSWIDFYNEVRPRTRP